MDEDDGLNVLDGDGSQRNGDQRHQAGSPTGDGERFEVAEEGEARSDAVSNVYAEALLEAAEATGELDSISEEVASLGAVLRDQPQLKALLTAPSLNHADRRDLIDRVFKDNVSSVVYRFLRVVNDKHRLAALPGIVKAFSEMLAERQGIVEADVWVPTKLADDQLETVRERLARAFDAKQVVVHQYEDPSLIGGLKVRIGDTLIDGSVASQLRRLRRQMVARGREQARQLTAISE